MTVAVEVAVVEVAVEVTEGDDALTRPWPWSLLKGNEITGKPVGRLVDLFALTVSAGTVVGIDGSVGVGVTTGVGAGRARVVGGAVFAADVLLMLLLLLGVVVLAVDEDRALEIRDGDCR